MLKVSLFAGLAEQIGRRVIEIPADTELTVSELRKRLTDRYPELHDAIAHCMVALNREYAKEEARISPDDEIVMIPPVSGG